MSTASWTIVLPGVWRIGIPFLISLSMACWTNIYHPTPGSSPYMLTFAAQSLPSSIARSCHTATHSSSINHFSSLQASITCTICCDISCSFISIVSVSCICISPSAPTTSCSSPATLFCQRWFIAASSRNWLFLHHVGTFFAAGHLSELLFSILENVWIETLPKYVSLRIGASILYDFSVMWYWCWK